MTEQESPVLDPTRFVPLGLMPRPDPAIRMPLHMTDRPLVGPGQRVEPGQPIISRFRDQEAVEVPTTAAIVGMRPGETFDRVPVPSEGRRGRSDATETYRARIVEHGRDGVTRLAAGSGEVHVQSPVAGTVISVVPGRIDIQAEGLAVAGRIGWGRPTAGRIVIAAGGPDAEVRASSIDVSAAGAVLVVGVRIDLEAISRARAIGAAAIISGGAAGRDLRQLAESEIRQQAALHAAAPFAFLALGGYGRAAIPRHIWDVLVAAEGRTAGILADERQLIIAGDPRPLLDATGRAPGTVRVAEGERREQEGRLVGLADPRRWNDGRYSPGGFVEFGDREGHQERTILPLSTLERLVIPEVSNGCRGGGDPDPRDAISRRDAGPCFSAGGCGRARGPHRAHGPARGWQDAVRLGIRARARDRRSRQQSEFRPDVGIRGPDPALPPGSVSPRRYR
jgi:hypothetical protein